MRKLGYFLVIATVATFFIIPVVNHELTHAYIYQEEGCTTNITYIPQLKLGELQNLDTGYLAATTADCPDYLDREDYERLDIKQTGVEASGYQLIPLYWLTALIFVLIWMKNEEETRKLEKRIDELESLTIKVNKTK